MKKLRLFLGLEQRTSALMRAAFLRFNGLIEERLPAIGARLRLLCAAAIHLLNSISRPSAIAGLISTIVVDTVKRKLWRGFRAHVCNECLKRKPFFTHANAARAVVFECRVVRIEATTLHGSPCSIFSSIYHAVASKASAAFCGANVESRTFSNEAIAAMA